MRECLSRQLPQSLLPLLHETDFIFAPLLSQFGNLLVLSVAARTPQLADLVPINTFEAILRRTIHFLKMQGRISPTLRQDSEILERSLLPPKSQSVSFSSSIEDNQY